MLFAEIQNQLLLTSCLTSSMFGVQQLNSGEDAFCDNGWTVIISIIVNLFNSVPKSIIKK